MADQEEVLSLTIDPSGAVSGLGQVEQGLGSLATASDKAQQAASGTGEALDQSGEHASAAGQKFDALGSATTVASSALSTAGQTANAFGVELGPLPGVAGEVTGALDGVTQGLQGLIVAGPLAAIAIGGLLAAFVGSSLNEAAAFGMEVNKLQLAFGLTEKAALSFADGMDQFGVSSSTIASGLGFFARQVEAAHDTFVQGERAMADMAEQTASRIGEANQRAAEQVGAAQRTLADQTQTAHDQMAAAADDLATKLGDLAEKHNETVASIAASMVDLASTTATRIQGIQRNEANSLHDMAQRHAETIGNLRDQIGTLTGDYAQSSEERKSNFDDTLQSMADAHQATLDRIAQSNSKNAAQQIAAENASYDRAVALAQKREDQAEQRAAAQYAKQLAALQKREADENASYARSVAKEQERANQQIATVLAEEKKKSDALDERLAKENVAYDRAIVRAQEAEDKKLAAIQTRLDKEEAAEVTSLGRIEKAREDAIAKAQDSQAKALGNQQATDPRFIAALREVLTAAGKSKDEIDAVVDKIRHGMNVMADDETMYAIADGFKALHEQAGSAGGSIDLAGKAAAIFGRGAGIEMLPALAQGGAAWRENANEAGRYKAALGDDWLAKLMAFKKAQDEMNDSFSQLKIRIGMEVMPVVTEFFGFLSTWVDAHKDDIVGFLKTVGEKIKDWGQFIIDHRGEIVGFIKDLGEKFHDIAVSPALASALDTIKSFGQWLVDHHQVVELAIAGIIGVKAVGGILGLVGALESLGGPNAAKGLGALGPGGLAAVGVAGVAAFALTQNNRPNSDANVKERTATAAGEQWDSMYTSTYNKYLGIYGATSQATTEAYDEMVTRWGLRTAFIAKQTAGLAGGMWNVPGPRGAGDIFQALLSPGEMVIPAAQADAIRSGAASGAKSGHTVNITGATFVFQGAAADPYNAGADFGAGLLDHLRAVGAA